MTNSSGMPDTALASGPTLAADTKPTVASSGGRSTDLPSRSSLGRYSILEKIGEGGMGVVYAAYDPTLDRRVAVKLVSFRGHERAAATSGARLQREARALARLNHPNVVVVHEVGESDGQLFIAMEFVEGQTVRDWVLSQERSVHEVIDLFCAAGRGLAAAHAVGLVHRDFKPGNVIVGEDGRVRVLDFGIAMRLADDSSEDQQAEDSPTEREDGALADARLTLDGQFVGTLAYMAPEQRGTYLPDARCDQYSFCVTLREALYFRARFYPDPEDLDASPYLSTTLEDIFERGTATEPKERFPDMESLLEAIESSPERARRRYREAAKALAKVWDDDRRRAVRARYARNADSEAMFERLEAEIDSYADDLIHTDPSHGGPHLEAEQENRLLGLRALVDELASSADSSLLGAAVGAVYNLKASPDPVAPIDDSDINEKRIRTALARAETLQGLGRLTEALELVEQQMAAADARGATSTRALAYLMRGDLLERTGQHTAAVSPLHAAALAAAEVGDKMLLARTWIKLFWLLGLRQSRTEAALALPLVIEAALLQCGNPPALRCTFSNAFAAVLWRSGDKDGAKAKHEETLALRIREFGEQHPDVAQSHLNLAVVLLDFWDNEAASEHLRKSESIYSATLGSEHPEIASVYCGLADVLMRQDRHDDALVELARAQSIIDSAAGPDSPRLIPILLTLAEALEGKGDSDGASTQYARVLVIADGVLDADHPYVSLARDRLGR